MKKPNKNKGNYKPNSLPLKTFAFTAKKVRAYGDFLKKYGINPNLVKNKEDFETLPITDKKNYLQEYSFIDLVPDGKIPPMISASSGSSGQPFYWPRDDGHEKWGGELHDIILRDIFKLKRKRVLAVICFSMGNWIAGTFTLASMREIARKKGFQLTTITPGIDKDDAIATLKNFANGFDAVILFGYPPFIMDVVVEAEAASVDLKKLNLHFVLAGENFSEKWRELLHKLAYVPKGEIRSISIYGTADAGAIGHETPLTIAVRELALTHNDFHNELCGPTSFLPTMVTYYPNKTYFELLNGELVFTAMTGIPLVRYNIKDHGILLSHIQIESLLKKHNLLTKSLSSLIKKWQTPVLVLKGRNDVSVTFYALNIYPENIKAGLEDNAIRSFVTGKYITYTKQSKDFREQTLHIEVELKPNITPSRIIKKNISDIIVKYLIELNTEYRKLFNSIHKKALPVIKLIPYGHEQFITRKAKHSWVKKN